MPLIQGPNATAPTDEFTAWGLAEFEAGRTNVTEPHYHDCDEYVFMLEGKMLMRSEGIDYVIVPGDVLVTRMGDKHEILEILQDARLLWLEGPLRGEKRHGHLHRDRGAER
jgi:mannose-6-phosphate isomerase-like protein (cupin superfamily)